MRFWGTTNSRSLKAQSPALRGSGSSALVSRSTSRLCGSKVCRTTRRRNCSGAPACRRDADAGVGDQLGPTEPRPRRDGQERQRLDGRSRRGAASRAGDEATNAMSGSARPNARSVWERVHPGKPSLLPGGVVPNPPRVRQSAYDACLSGGPKSADGQPSRQRPTIVCAEAGTNWGGHLECSAGCVISGTRAK